MGRRVTDAEFQKAWADCGGFPIEVAKLLGMGARGVFQRRQKLAEKGIVLKTGDARNGNNRFGPSPWKNVTEFPTRQNIECFDGSIAIASDCHFWPNERTAAYEAFLAVLKQVVPQYVILNGDVLDGARISRHDPMCWESGRPTLQQELEVCQDRLHEIREHAPNARFLWTIGNHDSRLERYLAMRAPEVHGMPGSALRDHFPGWDLSWSVMVNEKTSPTMVKHAFKGGAHAVYNNTLHAGISIVTGHLHAQLTRPFTDYRGTRYGVDCGTLADINGAQFSYTLDSPVNWRSGFAVLTYDEEGRLLPPDLAEVQTFGDYQRAVFRGAVVVESRRAA